jgi:hypothetical protein
MSTTENTAIEKQDVYARVTSQINAIDTRGRQLADAMAYLGQVRILITTMSWLLDDRGKVLQEILASLLECSELRCRRHSRC